MIQDFGAPSQDAQFQNEAVEEEGGWFSSRSIGAVSGNLENSSGIIPVLIPESYEKQKLMKIASNELVGPTVRNT